MVWFKKTSDIPSSEITPRALYLDRRRFLTGIPAAFAGAQALIGCDEVAHAAGPKLPGVAPNAMKIDEAITPQKDVTTYNNFYEFGTDKSDPARNAQKFKTSPWSLTVEGEVEKVVTFGLDDLMKLAPLEERVYRMRCVEGWSIVVPWVGYSLSALLKKAGVGPKAKYVAFQSFHDPKVMPLAKSDMAGISFPYVEGLRLDEAMHPLTLLTLGMYGESLPPQDGAPVRLIVPWKYGFKGIKSIVKVKLVESQPRTTWNLTNPREYGFYSNVNPEVDHPRWTQASERRLGEFRRRRTLMFNGYADQVGGLYAGLDLKKNY